MFFNLLFEIEKNRLSRWPVKCGGLPLAWAGGNRTTASVGWSGASSTGQAGGWDEKWGIFLSHIDDEVVGVELPGSLHC